MLPLLTADDLTAIGITSVGHRRRLLEAIAALGSAELAARLDPEDLREVMRAYQAACAEVVCGFEGHLEHGASDVRRD